MKKVWTNLAGLLAGVILLGSGSSVWAIKQFEVEFKKAYYKPTGTASDKAFAAAIDKITIEVEGEDGPVQNTCNACHVKGKKKEERNEYGEKLAELLDKKADKDSPAKIKEALDKVAAMKSSKGSTYGELIKSGKLPAE